AVSPDGKLLAGVVGDTGILFWDINSRRPISLPIMKHQSEISSLAFSADGKLLATGSLDKTVMLWDVATRQPLGKAFAWHSDYINALAFSPNGILASGYNDGVICLWDTNFASWRAQALRVASRQLSIAEENQFMNGLWQCGK